MDLRPELRPPAFAEDRIQRLAALAAELDDRYADPSLVAVFNREAGTDFEHRDFVGIYGGQDHDVWVRAVLTSNTVRRVDDVTDGELVELARRATDEAWFDDWEAYRLILGAQLPEAPISDLISWPSEVLGPEWPLDRALTPEQIVGYAKTGTLP